MAQTLNDKVAIVTGSSSGLGEAIALKFAAQGAKVTICGRSQERLSSVFGQAVTVSGGHEDRFLTVKGDLNDAVVRKKIISQTLEKFGRLDVLVANAGISDAKCSLLDATEESYNSIMDTNLKSVFFLIQEVVPHLSKSKGAIINVSSVASTLSSTTALVYAMSKAGLDHLTRCLAVDLGPEGIRVNSVNPGFIPTRILRYLEGDVEKITHERADVEMRKSALSGRAGAPEDVAEAVAFLASDSAGFITGENIRIDGGRSFGEPNGWSLSRKSQ